MLKEEYPFYLGGKPAKSAEKNEVTDKYSGEVATRVYMGDKDAIAQAIDMAVAAERPMRQLPNYRRKEILEHCARRFEERAEELAMSLCIEAGKPIGDSRGEVARLIDTFSIAAEESVRTLGEVMPLDRTLKSEGREGYWKRVPVGVCSFISPFNFPLNLAAHKVAPAIATGCPFVLKPASRTPIGALIIGEVLAETDLPDGAFSIIPCKVPDAEALITDERIQLLSFTGSAEVGWEMKRKAGKKRVVLELGGNAACVVDRGVDLDDAVDRMITGVFYQSGQSCISVQRIIVHEEVYDEFKQKMVSATKKLKAGDPKQEETFIGPLITEDDARRVSEWIAAAEKAGAKVLCGNKFEGAVHQATLLENVPRDAKIYREEVFGPVALISRFSKFEDAVAEVNDSRFGLQAGIFTRDLEHAHYAWDECEVGGVVINDVPSWRVDHMPYGGVKDSGFGREGTRWSIEDMTEIRLMVIRRRPI